MKRLGIKCGADLKTKSMPFLRQHFGSSAEWYYAIARGHDDRLVEPDRLRKSAGSETTFERDLVDCAAIEAGVLAMAGDAWGWCDKAPAFGRTVTVKIKFADFQQITRSRSHSVLIDLTTNCARQLSI